MNAPTLFDEPLARKTDPDTSHLAAQSVRASRKELVDRICAVLERCGPLTQEQIAVEVERSRPGYWHSSTIITACASACLHEWDRDVNSRGRPVIVWSLIPREDEEEEGVETIKLQTGVL